MTKDTRTARDAYMEHHEATVALLEQITTAVTNHDVPGANPESVDWGPRRVAGALARSPPGDRRPDVQRGRVRRVGGDHDEGRYSDE